MLRHIKIFIVTVLIGLCVVPALAPQIAYAQNPIDDACASAAAKKSPVCQTSGQDPVSGSNGILVKVARILSLIAGIGAVIVLIVGGFMHVTAGGDSSRVSNARKAIIGALVGLVVIALTQMFIALIVNLVE